MLLNRKATVKKEVLDELKEAVQVSLNILLQYLFHFLLFQIKLRTLRREEEHGNHLAKEPIDDQDPMLAHKNRMRGEVILFLNSIYSIFFAKENTQSLPSAFCSQVIRQMENIIETVETFESRACHCLTVCDKITMWHQRYVNV